MTNEAVPGGERPMFKVVLACMFCGSEDERQMPVNLGRKRMPWCRQCGVTDPKVGMAVRYGAPERSSEAAYADNFLTRGEVYRIAKVDRQQHGTKLTLASVGPAHARPAGSRWQPSFDLMLFTPVACDVEAARAWREEKQREQRKESR